MGPLNQTFIKNVLYRQEQLLPLLRLSPTKSPHSMILMMIHTRILDSTLSEDPHDGPEKDPRKDRSLRSISLFNEERKKNVRKLDAQKIHAWRRLGGSPVGSPELLGARLRRAPSALNSSVGLGAYTDTRMNQVRSSSSWPEPSRPISRFVTTYLVGPEGKRLCCCCCLGFKGRR